MALFLHISIGNILVSVVSGMSFLSAFRSFRVLRVFRSLKALRGMKLVSSVKQILAICKAVPSIIWTGILMVLIYYIFAVIGVSTFGTAFPEWFGDLGKAMYTLFQVMTLESRSMGISRPVMEVFPMAWIYFVPFVLISSFVVMNVVVGIVVNSISEVTTEKNNDEAEDENNDLSSELNVLKEHIAKLESLIEKQK
ncbi:MAG: ion transporter [Oscillospiraceae bacterium]